MKRKCKRKWNNEVKVLALLVLLAFAMSGCGRKSEESNEALETAGAQAEEIVNAAELSETPSPEPSASPSPEVEVSASPDPEEVTTPEPPPAPMSVEEMKSYFGEFQVDGIPDRTAIETEGIRLTWEDLNYLTNVCRVMPCFENQDALNENYYLGLINLSVSGPLGWAANEIVIIEEMEDYGCSSCAKISREEMENYVRNLLGTELPIYGPSKQEMLEREINFFYEDGYYYIGLFDWLDIGYEYLGYEVKENGNVIVEFAMYEAIDDLSAVLELAPAENENGFCIVSYVWRET